MPKTISKIILTSSLILINNLNCMLNKLPTKVISKNAIRFYYSKEDATVAKAIAELERALTEHGYHGYTIEVMNRKLQSKLCGMRQCQYPRHILDPEGTSIFNGDLKAVCLCTRRSHFDTEHHVIQVRLVAPKVE